jgi:hypothetical protein
MFMTSRRGPASSKVRKIGILFVAHSGVANPEVKPFKPFSDGFLGLTNLSLITLNLFQIWQYWASKAPSGCIAFYVFCNDEKELVSYDYICSMSGLT